MQIQLEYLTHMNILTRSTYFDSIKLYINTLSVLKGNYLKKETFMLWA